MNTMGKIVSINGHKLHFEVYGVDQAVPIIFLHHGLGSTKSWKFQVSDFVASGFQVILYDRWGYGESEPRPHFSMPEFHEDIEDLLGITNLFELDRINLIGHSDGGTISLYFSSLYPSIVSRLIVVAAHIFVEEKMIQGIESIRRNYESKQSFKRGLSTYHGIKTDDVFRNWYKGWRRDENLVWNMSAELKKVNCPTLIIQGCEDEHASPQHARDIHKNIVNSELVLLDNTAHMVLQENPQRINPIMINFIRGMNN